MYTVGGCTLCKPNQDPSPAGACQTVLPTSGTNTTACHRRMWREEEKGHVYSAVHQSTSIPLLLPRLWTSSSLRQKRDILWILVLLAHCTHIVSVAEDEVLFFLKRGLRVLGGACQETRQNFRGIVGNIFLFLTTHPSLWHLCEEDPIPLIK